MSSEPEDLAARVRAAVDVHRRGDLERAATMYAEILAQHPDQPDALHFHGVLCHQRGENAQALELMRRAMALAPQNPDMLLNYGNICRTRGDLEAAQRAYEEALELRSDFVEAWCNLGALLKRLGQREAAREKLETALTLNPNHAETLQYLGFMAQDREDWDRAEACFERAAELFPTAAGRANALQNQVRILARQLKHEKAEGVLRGWLREEPDNPVALHSLAAVSGEDVPAKASPAYVQAIFDRFAASFDEVLHELMYRAPDLVADRVRDQFADRKLPRVLDAGCGTGLSGVRLRSLAVELVGVDLSRSMLNMARERGIYDTLEEVEIVAYAAGHPTHYNLIVCVDTMNYFGDLDDVLGALHSALVPGGTLCFTLEKSVVSDAGRGYQLTTSGRYAHQQRYVEERLCNAGYAGFEIDDVVLRLEAGQPVFGFLILAEKPS